MTLDGVKKGQSFTIAHIPNDHVRAQAIRFGIAEGEWLTCEEVVPAGPVVVRKNRQLIAMGRQLAREIGVRLV
ncbi:ferrous iron transport protein A [Paradesulfitobacterium ferrireducens]|uniref:ferrous iron transport protein A n=1 Tax=Paradesulfitobacterium ferrireducens TaxID=2816476 RepID=UPI001A8C7E13|nr:ferrous iron transport protein A [Paradesulfitobacterium ferrireducens]